MRLTPHTHQQITRANKPGIIPAETTPPENIPLTQPAESVTIPTSEGECLSTHSTAPPRKPKRLSTSHKNTIQNSTPTERITPTRLPPFFITKEAIKVIEIPTQTNTTPLEHLYAPVIHPITGEYITNYKKLVKERATREVWTTAFGKEWVNSAQGYNKIETKVTN